MGDLTSILDVITKAGPYALFLVTGYAWQLERKERIEAQKQVYQLALDGLKAMSNATDAIRALRGKVRGEAD